MGSSAPTIPAVERPQPISAAAVAAVAAGEPGPAYGLRVRAYRRQRHQRGGQSGPPRPHPSGPRPNPVPPSLGVPPACGGEAGPPMSADGTALTNTPRIGETRPNDAETDVHTASAA
ncbi:hypothetical protein PJI17_23425 [Mycobacterium kansasii]